VCVSGKCLPVYVPVHVPGCTCVCTHVQGHNGCVNCVKFSPDGNWLASAGEDSRVKVGFILACSA